MTRSVAFPVLKTVPNPSTSFTIDGVNVSCDGYSSDYYLGYAFDGKTTTTWYNNNYGTHYITITCPKPTYIVGFQIVMGQYYGDGYKVYFDDALVYSRSIGNNGSDNMSFTPRLVTKIKLSINQASFINVAEFRLLKLVDTLTIIRINDSLYSFDDAGKMKLVSSSAVDVAPSHFLNDGFNIKDMTSAMEKQIKDIGGNYSILTMSN